MIVISWPFFCCSFLSELPVMQEHYSPACSPVPQGLFPPGQGATIGVDFMIKTVVVDGTKVKVLLRFVTLVLNGLHDDRIAVNNPASRRGQRSKITIEGW